MSTKSHGHHHPSQPSHNGNTVVVQFPSEQHAPAGHEAQIKMIEIRAYDLWEQAGKPEGDTARERFWNEAEKNVVASQTKG